LNELLQENVKKTRTDAEKLKIPNVTSNRANICPAAPKRNAKTSPHPKLKNDTKTQNPIRIVKYKPPKTHANNVKPTKMKTLTDHCNHLMQITQVRRSVPQHCPRSQTNVCFTHSTTARRRNGEQKTPTPKQRTPTRNPEATLQQKMKIPADPVDDDEDGNGDGNTP